MASSTPLPPTMRIWTRPSRGPHRTALHLTTVSTPSPPTGTEVLIRVSHVSLDQTGPNLFAAIPALLLYPNVMVPGLECSGSIVAAGPAAPADLQAPGTRVVAFHTLSAMLRGKGVLAEFVKLPAENAVIRLPDEVSAEEACAVNLSGQTGLKMLRTAEVKAEERVLIYGASGGVGSLLVQLCKIKGATVVGVASGGNKEMVRGLGADEFVDYRAHKDLPAHLTAAYEHQPFDHVLDCVGMQALYLGSPAYLKPAGLYTNVGQFQGTVPTFWYWFTNSWWPTWLGGTPRRYIMFSTPPRKDCGEELVQLLREKKIRVPVDSMWKMEELLDAYDRVVSKRTRGKVVLNVQDV